MSSIARSVDQTVRILVGAGALAFGILSGCHTPPVTQAEAREPVPVRQREAPPASGAKESTHPPVQPAPVESKTPEEAAKRAADPKDPSGALIIEPVKR